MVSGHYNVKLKTPMGLKKGELILEEQDGTLCGKMLVMGKENPLTDGKVSGDSFTFSGELTTAAGKMAFSCEGSVSGDEISGKVKTKKGDMPLSGLRA